MNTATDTLETNSPKTDAGITIGQSVTDKVSFFSATPVVQPTSASQSASTAITNSAGGTGAYGTGMQALTSTYNSGILSNSLATLATAVNDNRVLLIAIRAALVDLGIIKGS